MKLIEKTSLFCIQWKSQKKRIPWFFKSFHFCSRVFNGKIEYKIYCTWQCHDAKCHTITYCWFICVSKALNCFQCSVLFVVVGIFRNIFKSIKKKEKSKSIAISYCNTCRSIEHTMQPINDEI